MSKWSKARAKDREKRIARALIVGEYGDGDALEYIAQQSRADDGVRP